MKNVDNISKTVTASCILHNIALKNDDFGWVPTDIVHNTRNNDDNNFVNHQDVTGIDKRNNLTNL